VRDNFSLTLRRIDRHIELAFYAAKLDCAFRALVQQSDKLLVNRVDLLAPAVNRHASLLRMNIEV
jgi:hypothetical protein